ncbi:MULTISPECIES: hemopexin repeat-containing protein [unclassified Streptomyces]|uniref:hemopexin repeat-containing protein n=1 Tax=unclassified Streptomyces TaxID=2593676 RepID=UPI0033B1F521
MGAKVYFIKGANYARFALDPSPGTVEYVKSIGANWGSMAVRGFASGIDAAVNDGAGYVYFYKGGSYVRYDIAANNISDLAGEPPYPWPLTDGWSNFVTGTGFENYIDGALDVGDGSAWFFHDDRCLRGDAPSGILTGPDSISSLAPSLADAGFGSDIDDAVRLPNGKAYLFKGDQYVRADPLTLTVDSGYPLTIASQWFGFPAGFGAQDFDAVWINPNHP